MAQRIVQTSKRLAAERQIHAAIAHFHAGDFECAITLCSAAEGQMPEPSGSTYLFRQLRDKALQAEERRVARTTKNVAIAAAVLAGLGLVISVLAWLFPHH